MCKHIYMHQKIVFLTMILPVGLTQRRLTWQIHLEQWVESGYPVRSLLEHIPLGLLYESITFKFVLFNLQKLFIFFFFKTKVFVLPECKFIELKVPMQPRNRRSRPICQVTNNGLKFK